MHVSTAFEVPDRERSFPELPGDDLDLLVVDAMGKGICGPGLDTNVVDLVRFNNQAEVDAPSAAIDPSHRVVPRPSRRGDAEVSGTVPAAGSGTGFTWHSNVHDIFI